MNRNIILFLLSLVIFSSCEKEDNAVTLPPPGPVEQMVSVLGSDYASQVYVSLSGQAAVTRPYNAYDLTFETSEDGLHIWLNGAKLMFACKSNTYKLNDADTTGANWKVDNEQLNPDSAALGKWWEDLDDDKSRVFIIDRGKTEYSGADRFRKFQVISYDDEKYTVRFSDYDNTNVNQVDIPRDTLYSLMYLSFDNGGQLVQQAPPKAQWDFVFTKYTHVYFQFDVTSPFRNYPVTGALINIWNNTSAALLQKDSTPGYVAFDALTYANALSYNYNASADAIGFDWKYYDFNTSQYTVRPDRYYVIRDKDGIYYKLRIVDYYDAQGNKGTVTFQYQRL